MSFIELPGIDDVQEKKILPEGRYELVITANPTPKRNDKTGKLNMLAVLAVEGHPEAANVMHNITLPTSDDEDEAKKFKLLQIKRFCHWFDIDISGGMNTENFAGARSTQPLPLIVDEYQGETRNVLRLPPLPNEE